MSNTAWLVVALFIVGIAIAAYSLGLLAREKRLKGRLDELQRRGH